VVRTDTGKFRVNGIDVELVPEVDDADAAKLDRGDQLFEDFCIVTAGVRRGIDVNVTVKRSEDVPARSPHRREIARMSCGVT
jgi:organic hydroperoxide reductase OsmC/OhrA